MNCAVALTIFIRLVAESNAIPRSAALLVSQKSQAQMARPPEVSMIAQNIPSGTGQSSRPGEAPASPSSTATQSAQDAKPSAPAVASNPHKKSSASHAVKKGGVRRSKAKPGKVVVRNGGTTEPAIQFSTSVAPDQKSHDRQKTDGLLAATTSNIQRLSGRVLNPSQQDMLTQVRTYMQQAKEAEDAGDLPSAQNLALKAQLLSSDLARK